MYSFILSVVIFLVTVVALWLSQLGPQRRRKEKMHTMTVQTTNIVELHAKRARTKRDTLDRQVDSAVGLKR